MDVPYSFRRGKKGIFAYRRRVPDSLKAIVGKDWWKVSLKTADKTEARIKATALAAEHDALIGMPASQRRLHEMDALHAANHEDRRKDPGTPDWRRRTPLWTERQAAIERLALQMLAEAEKRLATLSENDRTAVEANGGLAPFWRPTEAAGAFNAYLQDKASHDGPGALLAEPDELITAAEAYQRREQLERDRSELAADAKQIRKREQVLERLNLKAPDTTTDDPDNPRINSVVERWLKHQGQSVGSARRHRHAWHRFVEGFGNVPVREITRAQVLEYRTKCEDIPDTRKLSVKDRDLSLSELAEFKYLPRISNGTVERHLISIKAMLTWCCSNVAGMEKSVASGIVAAKDKRRQSEKTRPFKSDELRKVLEEAPSHYDETRGRDRGRKRDMHWLIFLACYSGCRLEEMCQLARENIRQVDGVWVLDINADDGRKLKAPEFSTRIVPIHPMLIERGFIAFAQEPRGPRVFASFILRKSANGESYGNAASSSFARFLDKIGMPDPTLKFHSFRHTFIDALRNAEVPYSSELAIVGHADKLNPVHGRYGSGRVKVGVLAKHLARVDPLA